MVRISGKVLAELAMPNVCPACFKVSVRMGSQIRVNGKSFPFEKGIPGVFSNIDTHVKEVIGHYFQVYGKMPPWFPDLGSKVVSILKPPTWQTFNAYFPDQDIKMTGALDIIFKFEDGTYGFGDYKTAVFSENQDKLLPLYQAQLHNYLKIAEKSKIFMPVSKLFLIYTEPLNYKPDIEGKDENYKIEEFNDIFKLNFKPFHKIFDIDQNLTENLLKMASIIIAQDLPQSLIGCSNCVLRERLFMEELPIREKMASIVNHRKITPEEIPF